MGSKVVTIAKIVFALIFVVGLAVMMGTITNKTNSANTKLVDTLEMTDNASLDLYTDGAIVKGESVINAVKNVKTIGGDMKLEIVVKTSANDTEGAKYGYVGGSSSITTYKVTDSSDKNYINPTASFECQRVTNANDVITGLEFTQQ